MEIFENVLGRAQWIGGNQREIPMFIALFDAQQA